MQKVMENIIEQGQNKKRMTTNESAEEITRIFFVAARGMVYDWCLYDGEMDLRDEMKKVISIMVDGFKCYK